MLLYLYAEPAERWDGAAMAGESLAAHGNEILRFAEAVADAEVTFETLTYRELLNT